MSVILEQKINDILGESYDRFNRDDGVNVLSEDVDVNTDKKRVITEAEKTAYQKCFLKVMKDMGFDSIGKMSDEEKKDFFEKVKKECSSKTKGKTECKKK